MNQYIDELIDNNTYSLINAYNIKYAREEKGHYSKYANTRVAGAYTTEQPTEIMFNSEDIRIIG